MKKFATLICALLLVSLCGCGPEPARPTALAQEQPSNPSRLFDTWLVRGVSKDAKLDGDLLRKNIYLVLDCSTSMNQSCGGGKTKLQAVKDATTRFIGIIPENVNLGLTTFENSDVQEKVPLDVGNRSKLAAEINRVGANGGTPLSNAVQAGFEKLREQAKRQLGYGEYHLVVITDGEANPGYDPGPIVDEILKTSPVVIHTIGIRIGTGHSLNQPGKTIYKDARSPKDLEDGLAEIAAEADKF